METNINADKIKSIIEGILFAAGQPIEIKKLALSLALSQSDTEMYAEQLAQYYIQNSRGIRIIKIEDRLQLCSAKEYAEYIRIALEKQKKPSLSNASLEVLAIIAYKQPTTKVYIEHIRGVDSNNIVSSLLDKQLIEECGRLEVPGRPILYKTTDKFLRSFGISQLSELPVPADFQAAQLQN